MLVLQIPLSRNDSISGMVLMILEINVSVLRLMKMYGTQPVPAISPKQPMLPYDQAYG